MQMQQRPQQPCSRPVHIVLEETDFRCLVAGGQIEVDQWVGLRRVDLPIADELQPAANLAAACSVRRFTTRWIPLREASAFVAKHHRHNAPPKGAIVAVGLFGDRAFSWRYLVNANTRKARTELSAGAQDQMVDAAAKPGRDRTVRGARWQKRRSVRKRRGK
jgi:hypothetical protein